MLDSLAGFTAQMFMTTKHAAHVMASRGIKDDWVEYVLTHPQLVQGDPSDSDLQHFLASIVDYENRVLRVVAKRDTIPVVVITAFFDRTMKGKL